MSTAVSVPFSSNTAAHTSNQAVIIAFVDILGSDAFAASFSTESIEMESFYPWLLDNTSTAGKAIVAVMKAKVLRSKGRERGDSTTETTTPTREEIVGAMQTEQNRQLLRTALAVHTFGVKDGRIFTAFSVTMDRLNISTGFINAGGFLQSVCGGRKSKQRSAAPYHVPSVFQVLLFFHCLVVVQKAVKAKKGVQTRITYRTGDRIGFIVQTIVTSFSEVSRQLGLRGAGSAFAPYLLYNTSSGTFRALRTAQDGFAPLRQSTDLSACDAITVREGVCEVAYGRDDDTDSAFRELSGFFLDVLEDTVCNNVVYKGSWKDLQCSPFIRPFEGMDGALPPVFAELPDFVFSALSLDRPAGDIVIPVQPGTGRRRTARGNSGAGSSGEPGRASHSTARVKEEDIEAVPVPVHDTAASLAFQRAEVEQFEDELGKCGNIYDCSMDELDSTHSDVTGDDLEGKVDLVLVDPPYGIRKEASSPNSEHDVLSVEDMDKFCERAAFWLSAGGHGLIFCSYKQFEQWTGRLAAVVETVVDEDDMDDDDDRSEAGRGREQPAFVVEQTPLVFTRRRGHYTQDPRVRRLLHLNMHEFGVHFWRVGLTNERALARVNYMSDRVLPCTHPGYTNAVDNVPRVPPHEVVYSNLATEGGRRRMIRPEQKPVALLMDIINKFTSPGMLVLDCFAGTCSVAKACMNLPEHRKFVVCDKDADVINTSLPSVVDVFVEKALSSTSDVAITEGRKAAVDSYRQSRQVQLYQTDQERSGAPEGYPTMQILPGYLRHFLSITLDCPSLLTDLGTTPPSRWPTHIQAAFYASEVTALLGNECYALGVAVKPSRILHKSAGKGLFVTRAFGKGETICNYYGMLVYKDLTKSCNSRTSVGTGFMTVTSKEFKTWALEVVDQDNAEDRTNPAVWIYPAPFCAARFINSSKYVEGDETPIAERTRKENVGFQQKLRTWNRKELAWFNMQVIVAKRNIVAGEELYINYGDEYIFV